MKKEKATPKSSPLNKPINSIALPATVKGRLALVPELTLTPQQKRILFYVHDNPNSFTHKIGVDCAVGYPPARIWELNNDILPKCGLHLFCHAPKEWLKNRYGDVSKVQQWRLIKAPSGQSFKAGNGALIQRGDAP